MILDNSIKIYFCNKLTHDMYILKPRKSSLNIFRKCDLGSLSRLVPIEKLPRCYTQSREFVL